MKWNTETYQHIIIDYVTPWGVNLIFALAILFIGKWLARKVVNTAKHLMTKSKLDGVLITFLGSILNAMLMVVVVIAALDRLGVDTNSVLAIFAAAGLAVGLALKDSLSNLAAGVMLVVFKPFKIGDFIEAAGISGVVDMIGIFNTVMRTGDNREITVPNAHIYGGVITNFSARKTRRIDLVIGIGYDDNIQSAKKILADIAANDSRILKEPVVAITVSDLGESSIDLAFRPWVNATDYWAVRSDLLEMIKLQFDEANISIPYPQRDIHLFQLAG